MNLVGNRIGWPRIVVVACVLFSAAGGAQAEAPNTANPVTDTKVELGRPLYFDPRISTSQQISPATAVTSSTPSAWTTKSRRQDTRDNAAVETRRASTTRSSTSRSSGTVVLRSIPGYTPLFARVFPGEKDPLRRLRQCRPRVRTQADDACRYEVTDQEADKHLFKVPSLRNSAKAGPWFHDGSIQSLDEAIRLMAWHPLGKKLDAADVTSIAAFSNSLTGKPDATYIAQPQPQPLPSGPNTPKPDPT